MARFTTAVFALIIAFVSASCQSDSARQRTLAAAVETGVVPAGAEPFVAGAPGGPAIVTGCIWTTELSEVKGKWGHMLPGSGVAYPNPATSSVGLPYAVPIDVEIVWWVEKAYGPGESANSQSGQHAAGTFVVPGISVYGPVETFVAAGAHTFHWDGHDAFGGRLPQGYYRVYAYVPNGGWYAFWDVLIERS